MLSMETYIVWYVCVISIELKTKKKEITLQSKPKIDVSQLSLFLIQNCNQAIKRTSDKQGTAQGTIFNSL